MKLLSTNLFLLAFALILGACQLNTKVRNPASRPGTPEDVVTVSSGLPGARLVMSLTQEQFDSFTQSMQTSGVTVHKYISLNALPTVYKKIKLGRA